MGITETTEYFHNLIPVSYDVIVVDPPWQFMTWSDTNQIKLASNHYDLMQIEDILKLPVNRLAQRDCMLFLWATAPMLPQAMKCLEAWDFTYKTMMVWRKVTKHGKIRMGLGFWVRSMHELILIATIGHPKKHSAFPSIFDGIAREHSRKPDEFYALVEKHAAGIRRVDIFSRQTRPGWDAFGNEVGKFDEVPLPQCRQWYGADR